MKQAKEKKASPIYGKVMRAKSRIKRKSLPFGKGDFDIIVVTFQ